MLKENVRKNTKTLCLIVALLLMLGVLLIFAEVTRAQSDTFNWWLSVFLPLVVASVIATLFSLYLSGKDKNQYMIDLSSKERKISELEKLNFATNEELIRAQLSITAHEIWKARAIKCCPEIEHMVCMSFAKDEANNFQEKYSSLESLPASYNNYSVFVRALEDYHKLSNEAQSLVEFNMETIRQNLRKSLADYIKFAKESLANANESFGGIPEHLQDITKIINGYENLPATVKNRIPSTLITSLMMKKANAEYETAMRNGIKEDEELQKANKLFDSLNPKLSSLWTSTINWITEKYHTLLNFLTRKFEDEYKDEIIDENDTPEKKENSGDN